MKIVINYDLMEKIAEAKYGFSLKRECKIVSATVAVCYSFFSVLNGVAMNSIDFQGGSFLYHFMLFIPLF